MKSLLIILTITFTTNLFTQTDTILTKRFDAAEYNIDMAGRFLQDASGGFQRAWLFPFIGSLTTGILIATTDKNEENNIKFAVFAPAIIGFIGGIYNFFSATGDLKKAGYFLQKNNKKK